MGLIASFVDAAAKALPGQTQTAIGASIPTWQSGNPQTQAYSYERYAREGYGKNELVYACIQLLCESASEPRIAAYRGRGKDAEELPGAAVMKLFDQPNPFMSTKRFFATVQLFRAIAGNVFIEKVRARSRQVVELWFLRPDRVRVIPDAQKFIRGYEYRYGDVTYTLPPEDVIHIKTLNPWDDYYGMPPLAACAERVDTDNAMRAFTRAFFQNAAVPAGLLNIMKSVTETERVGIQQHLQRSYGGPAGWHSTLVIDNAQAKYEPMGMAIGERGIAMPSLDEINEARICASFGPPLSLVGARLGQASSSYANRRADREMFWDETLTPLYKDMGDDLTMGLAPEFPGDFDRLGWDLSNVQALQEDENAKVDRVSKKLHDGGITVQEYRKELGYDPEFTKGELLMISAGTTPTLVEDAIVEPMDPATEGDPGSPDYEPEPVGTNGRAH